MVKPIQNPREPVDTGTPELSKHYIVKPVLISQVTGRATHIKVQDQTEIDRLLLNDWITPDQYSAAETMANDIHIAGLTGIKASNYGKVIGHGNRSDITNREALRRLKIQKAVRYLDKRVGVAVRTMLVGVCRDELKVNKRGVEDHLVKGLDRLIIFYSRWD